MKRSPWFAIAALAVTAFAGGGVAARALYKPGPVDQSRTATLFRAALETVRANHVDGPERADLYGSAMAGLLAGLDDPYAELLRNESLRLYNQRMSGTRLGLRLQLRKHEGGMNIVGGSLRALRTDAGIGPGDEILAVNGRSTEGWTPADAARALADAGSAGSVVTLLVRPHGSESTEIRRVARTEVHVPAVSPGVLLSGSTGYLALHASTESAPEELRQAIVSLRERGMKRLVLDLRHNPGGLIPQAVRMASLFLGRGDTIAITKGRAVSHSRIYVDREAEVWPDMQVTLLVNRSTASAAELFAGALQDQDRATIVGTPTYGKGVIQTTFPLGNETAVKFTTARWYTPSGRSVRGEDSTSSNGIIPDVAVAGMPAADRVLARMFGTQYELFQIVLATHIDGLRAGGAREVRAGVPTRAMQQDLWTRFVAAGGRMDRDKFEQAGPYVRERMRDESVRQVWGEEAALRRELTNDPQVQAALAHRAASVKVSR